MIVLPDAAPKRDPEKQGLAGRHRVDAGHCFPGVSVFKYFQAGDLVLISEGHSCRLFTTWLTGALVAGRPEGSFLPPVGFRNLSERFEGP